MRLRDIWSKLARAAQEPQGLETGPKAERTLSFTTPWVRQQQRRGLWQDIEALDRDEPIIARGLDFIARFATTFADIGSEGEGFVLEGPDEEVEVLEPIANVLRLQSFERVRSMVKFGDLFGEVVASPDGQIVDFKIFPYAYQIVENRDEFGRLRTGDPEAALRSKTPGVAAYDQFDDSGALVACFSPYQIVHGVFGRRQGLTYAEPHLGCVVSVAKRLRAVEDGLTIARLTRAYPRVVHRVPIALGTSEQGVREKIRQYRELIGTDTTLPYDADSGSFTVASRSTPPAVDTAYFLPRMYSADGTRVVDGDVTNLPADDPNLRNLEDVYLLLRRMLAGVGVPSDFLNLSVGERAFIDRTSPERREAFLYLCRAVQAADRRVVQTILDLQLLLNGLNPLRASYQIVQPRISPKEADVAAMIDLRRANTAAIWASIGVPKEIIGHRILQLTPAEVAAWAGSPGPSQEQQEQLQAWVDYARLQLMPVKETV